MGNNQTWGNINRQINDAVSYSLKTGDFSKLQNLGEVISSTLAENVGRIIDSVPSASVKKESVQTSGSQQQKSASSSGADGSFENLTEKWIKDRAKRPLTGRVVDESHAKIEIPFKRVGKSSGTVLKVFGWIGVFIFGIPAILSGGIPFLVISSLVSLGMILLGTVKHNRLKRAEKYARICGKNRYSDISRISDYCGRSFSYTLRDIKKLLRLGFFPQGHLDKKKTCLMLDDGVFEEYLELEKRMSVKALDQTKPHIDESPSPENEEPPVSELDGMMREGAEQLALLKELNDKIPGEVISDKLSRLEGLLGDIFDRLKEHPEQQPMLHEFMSYYLPMTVNLVKAYEEFDSLSTQGEDIIDAKQEIEKTLDTINDAFGELLARLYRSAAYDAATDAQALKSMLEREGLTGGDFDINK